MSSDSGLFQNEPGEGLLPLYEAKMFHQFDHRWATYEETGTIDVNLSQRSDQNFAVTPRYWVSRSEVENRLAGKWDKQWLIAFRDITNVTNERTAIFSLLPKVAIGHTSPILLINKGSLLTSCLLSNFTSLVFDFVTRQKLGGTHLTFFILKQLPVLPPETYTQTHIHYIAPRVLELTYTAWDLQPFADDLWSSAVAEWFSGEDRGVGEEGSRGRGERGEDRGQGKRVWNGVDTGATEMGSRKEGN